MTPVDPKALVDDGKNRRKFYLKLHQTGGDYPGEKSFCDWPCLIKYATRWLKIEQIEKP